jgi:putative transposase
MQILMPRQPRYFLPGIPQHVVQRGVDRQPVFFDKGDYDLYLRTLHEAATKNACLVHAYVLMTNHTHLLITPGHKRALPLLMQAIGRQYVQSLNRKRGRTGTLWEGRYKACPVQTDYYLLACYRYIELNPVRAGLVLSPADYAYSSFRRNALGRNDPVITSHSVYSELGETSPDRQLGYQRLFEHEFSPEQLTTIRRTTESCHVLGNDDFVDRIEATLGRPVRPGKRGRPKISVRP